MEGLIYLLVAAFFGWVTVSYLSTADESDLNPPKPTTTKQIIHTLLLNLKYLGIMIVAGLIAIAFLGEGLLWYFVAIFNLAAIARLWLGIAREKP